jgi:MerR family transcriptional regulator, aldehyde-responsive regulator
VPSGSASRTCALTWPTPGGGDEAAGEQRALFEAHARRVAAEMAALELRRHYLELKVRYWSAREAGDLDKAAAVAEELAPIIRRMNPKDTA